ncbi:methyl-accepting chemotaxis protein [Roseobacter cerasinus]|uniref:Methyl-accepting chemotaxis protein n=1 Tax=Roseobacter cerasinus TaxID=2602289 RepID=A0A640VS05_9RHOB|nr:PAS domain-containing methyl-accepting chemotaxis protein [Roseobacter cerasinus]GFE51178.1 methyl-accepting chemotaxis protein [Roseobacter cerasinus]
MARLFRKSPPTPSSSHEHAAFLAAIDNSHVLVWFAPDGTILDVNENFCQLFGYTKDEVVGKSRRILLDKDDPEDKDEEAAIRGLKSPGPRADVVGRVTKTGQKLWLSATYLPITDAAGKVVKMVTVSHDLTSKVELERAEKQNLLRQIEAISATHGRVVYDVDGKILEVNDMALDLLGYEREEFVGENYAKLVHPDYAGTDRYEKFLEEVKNGVVPAGNFKRFRKDGTGLWVQSIYCPERDKDGNVVRMISVKSDVTAIMEANDMTNTITKIQAVIEFSPDGTIRHANDLFLGAMGYTLDEIVGKHHSMFMPDGEVDTPEYAAHWRILQEGKFHTGEYRRRAKDGSDVWIAASYTPVIGPNGETVKVVKYATDITPRVQAIKSLRDGLAHLAEGDLRHEILGTFGRDFDPLKQDFNTAIAKLRTSLGGVVEASREIDSGTKEISTASDDLSRRTESQAASLEETAAAIAEMSASVKSTADIARNTRDVVEKTKSRATASSEVMAQARTAMDAISSSSDEISKITSMIEDIAFQTNLLALNAGVEAARAGEAGRGFAVVASEVRALAQRSSEAATQIAHLIATSANQVHEGVDLVSKTGESLAEIDSFVADLTKMVADIAAAAAEQSGGLDEINGSVSALDDVTQRNAAMFEETNAATQLLTNEVEKLGKIATSFSIGTEGEDAIASPDRLAS